MQFIYLFIGVAFAYRIAMLGVSIRNERSLRAGGAVEFGARNSKLLAGAHVAFYVAAATEGVIRQPPFDEVTLTGLALYLFGSVMLFVVARTLGRLWTVKLLIANDHVLVTSSLFKVFRHPNYFLNILPELIGYALVLHAFLTLGIGLIIYIVPLALRIREEERVMRDVFRSY
ncbi:isoprenylcysteine carboxyl methyltransferase family protein [Sphingomonas xinjiangensis]|uniref:Isoprenylcysteine carboxyl methyltransferase (ICMT) family protein YpbQ n=1 Tax=Sphingomonas xinjiangensis TaxID=643568 RepID=A0A840YRM3_9SPHN|nr:isoprenylcysteine carboxylmethyltransferase family protein [Sphingomonas xinjiangensis]MBB5711843.1 isoprenylcysteine carboxyl methyltransferase (ICMT) family protein YpbQ [Sphingomonas xinjiangensis]